MGPAVIKSIGRPLKGPVEGPSRAVENSHFAKQIGTAISNSVAPFR